jgi:hypothetical protein
MQIVERANRVTRRISRGFSLAEATRIRQDIVTKKREVECPRCAGNLGTEHIGGEEDAIWMAKCPDCGLSLMVHHRLGDIS